MKTQWIWFVSAVGLGLGACTTQPAPDSLQQFLSDREVCDHLRGEIPEPSDKARLQEVIAEINQYCVGTDARLAAIKARYAHDPEVMARLNALEAQIEGKRR
jgi:hypothetical protein